MGISRQSGRDRHFSGSQVNQKVYETMVGAMRSVRKAYRGVEGCPSRDESMRLGQTWRRRNAAISGTLDFNEIFLRVWILKPGWNDGINGIPEVAGLMKSGSLMACRCEVRKRWASFRAKQPNISRVIYQNLTLHLYCQGGVQKLSPILILFLLVWRQLSLSSATTRSSTNYSRIIKCNWLSIIKVLESP